MRNSFHIIITLLLIFFAAEARGAVLIETAPEVGKTAPAFELKDLSGARVRLAEVRGKVVLLNFWAEWCGPCRAEMPFMESLYKAFKDKGLVVLAVSVDRSEKEVKAFVSDKKLTFKVLMDKDKEVSFDQYGVIGLPTTFLIDKKGVIAEKFIGPMEWDSAEMKDTVSRLLRGNN